MKTMLVQNWVNKFKRPTYFLEMEMSPRQIWKRFIQIEQGWTEEELAKKYASTDFRIADKFDWLNVDYQSCFAIELEKRISMLPVKPEIVVWFGKPNNLTAVVFPFASMIELAGPSPAIILMVLLSSLMES